jgi:vacuolar protein sorting-associated protein 13A/C
MVIFGLDLLGNPYNVIRGLTEGVTSFFYEPYAGLVEGPDEFLQGIGLGFRNLVGSTLGK